MHLYSVINSFVKHSCNLAETWSPFTVHQEINPFTIHQEFIPFILTKSSFPLSRPEQV